MGDEKEKKASNSALQADIAHQRAAGSMENYWRSQQGQFSGVAGSTTSVSSGYIVGGAGPTVHYFKGTDSPARPTPCGALLAVQAEGKGPGIRLTGLVASESLSEVTCVACLRALVARRR